MANKIAKKVLTDDGVRFEFSDGEIINCPLAALPDNMMWKLAQHGLSQKVGDSYAGADSITEARVMASGVYQNLLGAMWAVKVGRGGKIIEALHRALGMPLEVCLEKWTAMDDAKQKTVRAHPDIKRALADIEAERAEKLAEAAIDAPDLGELL